jgi:hypothetical protein
MPAKSDATRIREAGSCVNVEINVKLTFNEMMSLQWALKRIKELTASGVVPVPKEVDVCFHPALDHVLDRIFQVGPEADRQVGEMARQEKFK